MLRLFFGANSPYARKVRVVLAELQIPFESVPADTANPSAEFLAVNPNRRIPALSDGDTQLFESNIILDYLLREYPNTGKGDPPLSAALVRPEHRWDDWKILVTIETMLDSGLNLFQMNKSGIGPEQAPYLQAEQRRIQSDLDWLEQRASPGGFVQGAFSVLDLNLVCALEWANFRQPFEWSGRPKLAAIVELHKDRESISTTRPG